MVGRTNIRTYLYLVVGVATTALLLAILYTSNPALPARTKGFILNIVGQHDSSPSKPPADSMAIGGGANLLENPVTDDEKTPPAAGDSAAAGGAPPPAADAKEDKPKDGKEDGGIEWFTDKWPFQADVDGYDLPKFDIEQLKNFPPHNYKGPGHPTFATFYASRNATMQDPYFVAAQQIIYRTLWDPKSRSEKYPMTVFVSSFVTEEQRDYFRAAGAIVRELGLRPFEPSMNGVPARLRDMFSKLEMWKQTDFSRIAYLDSDAFPLQNPDKIFDVAKEEMCKKDRLPEEDQTYGPDICSYVFACHLEAEDSVNAGVMILKPEQAMYQRLTRESQNTTGWDTGYMEQAFLSYAFSSKSPFPVTSIGPEWNSFHDNREKGIDIIILHDKMWSHYFEPGLWPTANYEEAWARLLKLYESEEFLRAREADMKDVIEDIDKDQKKGAAESKPEDKPADKPEDKPADKPEAKPDDKPEDKPEEHKGDDKLERRAKRRANRWRRS